MSYGIQLYTSDGFIDSSLIESAFLIYSYHSQGSQTASFSLPITYDANTMSYNITFYDMQVDPDAMEVRAVDAIIYPSVSISGSSVTLSAAGSSSYGSSIGTFSSRWFYINFFRHQKI